MGSRGSLQPAAATRSFIFAGGNAMLSIRRHSSFSRVFVRRHLRPSAMPSFVGHDPEKRLRFRGYPGPPPPARRGVNRSLLGNPSSSESQPPSARSHSRSCFPGSCTRSSFSRGARAIPAACPGQTHPSGDEPARPARGRRRPPPLGMEPVPPKSRRRPGRSPRPTREEPARSTKSRRPLRLPRTLLSLVRNYSRPVSRSTEAAT